MGKKNLPISSSKQLKYRIAKQIQLDKIPKILLVPNLSILNLSKLVPPFDHLRHVVYHIVYKGCVCQWN